MLALVVHVLVNQKYVGHLVAIIAYVFIAVARGMLGIEHNLLVYGAGPGWSYTDMRGFGPSLGPWLWFKLYWAAWALLLAVVARLLWVRGRERGLGVRLQLARRRLTRPTAWTAAAAAVLVLALGGFVFYNTNVLNEYRSAVRRSRSGAPSTSDATGGTRASRSRELTGTSLRVEIHPERRAVEIRGSYRLVNRSATADRLHPRGHGDARRRDRRGDVRPAGGAACSTTRSSATGSTRSSSRSQPGDSLRLDFEVHVEPHGFSNRGVDPSVVANGTYFTNRRGFPPSAISDSRELMSAATGGSTGSRRAR